MCTRFVPKIWVPNLQNPSVRVKKSRLPLFLGSRSPYDLIPFLLWNKILCHPLLSIPNRRPGARSSPVAAAAGLKHCHYRRSQQGLRPEATTAGGPCRHCRSRVPCPSRGTCHAGGPHQGGTVSYPLWCWTSVSTVGQSEFLRKVCGSVIFFTL